MAVLSVVRGRRVVAALVVLAVLHAAAHRRQMAVHFQSTHESHDLKTDALLINTG